MKEMKKREVPGQRDTEILENLWLTYFNDSLYCRGVISETERNKMRVMIKRRHA